MTYKKKDNIPAAISDYFANLGRSRGNGKGRPRTPTEQLTKKQRERRERDQRRIDKCNLQQSVLVAPRLNKAINK